jgi:hypothetical protein
MVDGRPSRRWRWAGAPSCALNFLLRVPLKWRIEYPYIVVAKIGDANTSLVR